MNHRIFGYTGSASYLVIDEREAEIIRHIYRAYAGGESRMQICAKLNGAGIPAPLHWRNSGAVGWFVSHLFSGHRKRSAILGREIYAGRLIFNRGLHRERQASEWVVQDAPLLRIIDKLLWTTVQARLITEQPSSGYRAGDRT